jgi:hypothetical protein
MALPKDTEPLQLTAEDVAEPLQLSAEDVAEPLQLSAEDVAEPMQLSAEDVNPRGTWEKTGDAIADAGRQAFAGVARDFPRMVYRTAAALLPGETPNAGNTEGSGIAGAAGAVAQGIDAAEEAAWWDDPEVQGWGGVPAAAARSMAPNAMIAAATKGKATGVMPVLYGASRAQEVFERLRDQAAKDGAEFNEGAARVQAAGAGLLEGGLEYVSNLFGMNKQLRRLFSAKAGAAVQRELPQVAATMAAKVRALAGKIVRTGGSEAGTEAIQEGGGDLHEQLLGIAEGMEQRPESLLEVDWDRVWDRASKAAAAGALSSGVLGGINAAAQRVQETRDAREKRERVAVGSSSGSGESGEVSGERLAVNGGEEVAPIDGLAEQEERDDEGLEADPKQAATADAAGGGTAAAAQEQAAADGAQAALGADRNTPPPLPLTEEEAREADAQAEKNAARDYATRLKMGANVSDELTQGNPVKAAVLELGGIRMDGTEDQRGIPAGFRSASPNAQPLDQILRELQGDARYQDENGVSKYADWSADDLIEALKGNEADKRKRFSERPTTPDERAWLKSAWTVAPQNLAVGFSFTVKGVPYRVADADADGYVIERTDGKDAGWVARLDNGKLMNIDGGSLKNATGARVGKIKNYADPEQVRMWEEQGADEAMLAGEGALDTTDEDQPFRAEDRGQKTEDGGQKTEDGDQQERAKAPGARPVAQVRMVRRGYDAQREAADDPAYSRWSQQPMDLPELVEMATDLMAGKVPRILKQLDPGGKAAGAIKFRSETNAAGARVFGRPEVMTLLAANYKLVSDDEEAQMREDAELAAGQLTTDEAERAELAKQLFDAAYMAEVRARIAAGPRFAMAVIAHEIGHIADQAAKYGLVKPDRSQGKNRLNLIGRVAGMLSWTRDVLADDPSGKTLTPDEVRTLQGRARKNAQPDRRGRELMRSIMEKWAQTPELRNLPTNSELATLANAAGFRDALEYMARERPVLSEWFAITTYPEQVRATLDALKSMAASQTTQQGRRLGSAWFRAEFVKGLEARRQAHLGKMYSELESIIAWWNNGDRTMMAKYFERPAEMFAEAWSVFLNNPGAVRKRAPMFWRTLQDYMGARPEVQEWLEAFNEDMSRGPEAKYARRDARLSDMFGRERRAANRAVEQAGAAGQTRRMAADGARYMLSRKSGPLHALVKTADALGLSNITERVALWSDKVENVAALEKAFAAEMNEVGRLLDEGGLTVEEFDKWAYLNMVALSPAYTQKANPLGFHPQAAREQLAFLRQQMGDAKANQLQKAVERFQALWQRNVIDRVEGMYDAETMEKLRANPVYFTLMVGMDDAEIKAFQTALQTMDEDQMMAFAQRTINNSVFGQPAPGGIIRRTGTHRPAMSLFGATLLKGVRMINDATRNELALATKDLLETLKDPYYLDVAESEPATDTKAQTVVRYFKDGKQRAYYAPAFVGYYVRGDNPWAKPNAAVEVIRKYTLVNVWKRLQTMWSLKFMTTQPIADAKAWNTQMKGVRTPIGNIARGHVLGGLAQMLPASTWYLPASVFPPQSRERLMRPAREVIRRFYQTGEIHPRLDQLIERGMTDMNGAFQGMSRADPDAGEILQLFAGIKPAKALEVYAQDLNAWQRGWKRLEKAPAFGALFKASGRAFEALQQQMQVENLANKMAGMEYLDAKYPQMSEREKRKWVLHAAGNPNFAARAGADPLLDTFAWTFFNPAKEGYRSVLMAAKADPAGFMARAMWYNVAPNLIKWGAASGVLYAVAEAIIPHGETPEDEEDRQRWMDAFKRWTDLFKRIPSYYGRRYVTVPIMPVGTDSALSITIPQAQSMAPVNSLVNVMLDELSEATGMQPASNKGVERAITAVTDEVAGLKALSGQNRSALVQVFGPIIEMLTTDKNNVYDPFYGRNILDRNEEELMAGGRYMWKAWPAWQKLGQNAWNSAVGSAIGRFDTKTPRADMPLKTDLQKVLTAPGVSTLIGGLLRVTGGGEFERMEDMFSAEGQNRAYDNIMVRKAALDTLRDPQRRFPEWAAAKYLDDPQFQKNWNEYIISHEIYSEMTPEDRALYGRRNPVWQRMMLIREQQKRTE